MESPFINKVDLLIFILLPIIGTQCIYYPSISVSAEPEPIAYQPEIVNVKTYPNSCCIPPNSQVKIYAHVKDIYADIRNTTLVYSFDNEKTYRAKMNLINGTKRNGIYVGIIPPIENLPNGTRISYRMHFEDSLNYSTTFQNDYVTLEDIHAPHLNGELESLYDQYQGYIATVTSPTISDNASGIRNVILHYMISDSPLEKYDEFEPCVKGVSCINMTLIQGDKWEGEYEADIFLKLANKRFSYYLEAVDHKGLNSSSEINSFYIDESPWWKQFLNHVFLDLSITDINIKELTAQMKTNIEIPVLVNTSFPDKGGFPDSVFPEDGFPEAFWVSNAESFATYASDELLDSFEIYLYNNNKADRKSFPKNSGLTSVGMNQTEYERMNVIASANLMSDIVDGSDFSTISGEDKLHFSDNPNIQNIHLIGDPLLYPFDHYYVKLSLTPRLPYYLGDDIRFNLDNQDVYFGNALKSIWDPIIQEKSIGDDNGAYYGDGLYIHLDFKRNISILIVIIPLLAIFYLLGSIFLFENSIDHIANRLTLTLGIFALIFTLPEIIDSYEPTAGGSTIADSMLSIIVISTIAFTISSIVSSSSIIQRWFPKHHYWIDRIAFVMVTVFVIFYFYKYLFDSYLWWLVPVIVFGLGYGLLLRVLGFRIKGQLIGELFKHKKKRIADLVRNSRIMNGKL